MRLAGHIRSNAVGYVAVFIALSGTAWATAQIGANDIRDNAVRSKHIKAANVRGQDVDADEVQLRVGTTCPEGQAIRVVNLDGTVACELDDVGATSTEGPPLGPAAGDLTGSYPAPTIAPGAVNSEKVADGSLGGADVADTSSLGGSEINEASLAGSAISGVNAVSVGGIPPAEVGGVGRSAVNDEECFPTAAGVDCATLNLELPRAANVLVIASLTWAVSVFDDTGTDIATYAYGQCVVSSPGPGDAASTGPFGEQQTAAGAIAWSQPGNVLEGFGAASAVGLTGTLSAGSHSLKLHCTEIDGDIFIERATLTAVILGSA